MRIGLLSDTHIPEAEKALPPQVTEAFRGVDLILHAGDIYIPSVLDDLERIAPVYAARGDDDYGDTLTDRRVKERHILELGGKTVWLIHDRTGSAVPPWQSSPWPTVSARESSPWWQSHFAPEPDKSKLPDIIVFGHEHRAVVQPVNGTIFVNPGSPTFLEYRRGLGTVGLLDIDSGKANVRIVHL